MKVLIACEFSGIVRDAFIAQGHEAISCDLLPSEKEGPHYQGDIKELNLSDYDLMIAHPPCTHLAVSGARWFKDKQVEQDEAHGETKATCLWLKNLPKLIPTDIVDGRDPRIHHMSPGPERWRERSRTMTGIAAAMADQWSNL